MHEHHHEQASAGRLLHSSSGESSWSWLRSQAATIFLVRTTFSMEIPMRTLQLLAFTVVLLVALPLLGQHSRQKGELSKSGEHGVGNGHIPAHGPAPVHAPAVLEN
jgi:hypothetical protein